MAASHKWLPAVTDYCSGCGECVKACPHACLELIWDFATLKRADHCVSEGACVKACEFDSIRMDWLPAAGNEQVGHWCDQPALRRVPTPLLIRLGQLFSKRSIAGSDDEQEHAMPAQITGSCTAREPS